MFDRLTAPLKFRTRSAGRDTMTDESRRARLLALIDEIAVEVESERDGLKARYGAACTDAGFAVDAQEQDRVPGLSTKVQTLTETILACENRLAVLSRQMKVLDAIGKTLQGLDSAFQTAPDSTT